MPVNTLSDRCVALLNISKPSIAAGALRVALLGIAPSLLWHAAHADNFREVRYDAAKDQLVITMVYRGTNPNHTFSLKWGACKDVHSDSVREVAAEVLDSQSRDAAQGAYTKTTRFNLSELPCRPAKVTLRTAPRFIYTVLIPPASSARQ
jgi:hypothetical protein